MPCQQAPIHREKKAPAFFLGIATVSASTFAEFASIHCSHRKIMHRKIMHRKIIKSSSAR